MSFFCQILRKHGFLWAKCLFLSNLKRDMMKTIKSKKKKI